MDVHKDSVMIAVLPEGVPGADTGEAAVARSAGTQTVAGPFGAGARGSHLLRGERLRHRIAMVLTACRSGEVRGAR